MTSNSTDLYLTKFAANHEIPTSHYKKMYLIFASMLAILSQAEGHYRHAFLTPVSMSCVCFSPICVSVYVSSGMQYVGLCK